MTRVNIDVRELRNAYLAGIFDGEGDLSRSGKTGLQLGIAQANYPFLDKIREEYEGNLNQHEGCWQWSLRGSAAKQIKFLDDVAPYVVLRSEEVTIALEILKLSPGTSRQQEPLRVTLLREKLFEALKEAAERRRFGFREKP